MPDGSGFTVSDVDPRDAERDALLRELAALDPIAYDQRRQSAADALGVRVSALDEAVKPLREKPDATQGRFVALAVVEPWPDPVAAGAVLDELLEAVRRHVVLRPSAAAAVALWIAHTYVAARFQHTPRLGVTSPAKRCGKSTLLDVLRATCHRPIKADNISASGVFRTVEALSPLTLLLDEADAYLADNEELRGVLNSGFERSGEVIRVVEVDGEHQPVRFRTFAPLALAGIGALPGTLEDRAVPITLERKGAGERADKLRAPGARAALADVARKLARWAADRGPRLHLDPAIPDALGDREGDICVPLLSIADDAGGAWPEKARAALLDLFGRRQANEGGMEAGALLLADPRGLFNQPRRDGTVLELPRLFSAEIVAALGAMEERPWPEWRQGKPMTAPQLARALAPFGVRPTTLRQGDGVAKGYKREAFKDAWARYLPAEKVPAAPATDPLSRPEGGCEPLHRNKPSKSNTYAQGGAVTADGAVTGRKAPKSPQNGHCNGVTAENPLPGPEGCPEAPVTAPASNGKARGWRATA